MRNLPRLAWLVGLAGISLIASSTPRLFAQEEDPEALAADGSDLAPAGVSGNFSGSITTGCAYDPFTHNFRREIDDIVVPGTIGAYPLKFSRTYNSKDLKKWEADALPLGALGNSMAPYWRHSYSFAVGDWHNSNGNKSGEGFVFPDGRVIPRQAECQPSPAPIEETWDESTRIWTMADGGKMHLGSWYVDEITDPYGLKTKIYHDTAYPNQNRITKVEEPGGKYLEFTYWTTTEDNNLIKRVVARDKNGALMGLSADYSYSTYTSQAGSIRVLTRVDYSDGTHASYDWTPAPDGSTPTFMKTAYDQHLAGPMRHIEYYKQDGEIASERRSSSVPVSTISTGSGAVRTETRGDGATRTFTYGINIKQCDPGGPEPHSLVPNPLAVSWLFDRFH